MNMSHKFISWTLGKLAEASPEEKATTKMASLLCSLAFLFLLVHRKISQCDYTAIEPQHTVVQYLICGEY